MEKKRFRKKLLILLMIISIVATDFFILGSNLVTYSSDISDETNNPNVEFSAYLKNDANERVDSIEKSIKDENLKLYAEVAVKNEGYLNEGTAIEIEDSNFNLQSNISSPYIKEINGNKVVLKQITAGETVEIELAIEPIITEKLTADLLSKISIVKLNGSYTGSTETGIQYGKQVCIDFQVDETAQAELETEIITNKVIAVSGTNKRMVQVLIKSRLTENQYPIQQTKINASIPQLGGETAEVNVMAIGTLATNGQKTLNADSWTTENGTVEITIKNDADTNNEITWNKNIYDEIVVTYLYPETVDASKIEIETNSELKLYNSENTYTATDTKSIENKEPNNVIMGKTEIITQEMYKGQIYANVDAPYNTKTTIVVTNSNIADKIIVNEGLDTLGKDEKEASVNTKYVATKINIAEMLSILGQDGSIQIKSGETTTIINKDTESDENGNIFIYYEEPSSTIEITTSKPANEGILEIEHTKAIAENSYTRAQLETVKTLNVKSQTSATLDETIVVENALEQAIIELKETISKAELTIENNKNTLSTTEENEVTLGITLITNGTQYDLYKNPEISLQFPAAVENVEIIDSLNKQNADEFAVSIGNYNTSDRTLKISLSGEQTAYPESALTQTYIQLNLNITLSKLATDQADKIIMTYTNENANKYYGETTDFGVIEKEVQISGQPGLIKYFNLNLNENTSLTEAIKQQITEENAGKIISFETLLLNNTGSNMNNIRIVGKLPTTGNKIQEKNENTLETILTNILAENATIYYTENVNATVDIEDSANGWTTDLATLTNAKLYLIKLDTLSQGSCYAATVNVQIPSILDAGLSSYTQYKVIYDTEHATNIEETSRNIQLATASNSNLQVNLTAQVGGQELANGDTVKEGEVIKYAATVTNTGNENLKNVQIKVNVPEGTTLVTPMEDYANRDIYYDEVSDSEKIEGITSKTILELKAEETYSVEFEVRVNQEVENAQILNQAIVIYHNYEIKSEKITNTIKEANIRVTIKRGVDEYIELTSGEKVKYQIAPGDSTQYIVYVENLSDSKIKDINLKIISDGFNVLAMNNVLQTSAELYIEELTSKKSDDGDYSNGVEGVISIPVYGKIDFDIEKMSISAIVKDSLGEEYRANALTEEIPYVNEKINLTSSKDGQYIRQGDIVDYKITVENAGDIQRNIKISDVIPDILEIQSISVDGVVKLQTTNESHSTYTGKITNNVMLTLDLDKQQKAEIDIITKVGYISELYSGEIITNTATALTTGTYRVSEMVTHILLADSDQQENLKNIVSGFVWLDTNSNGQKDVDESTIGGVLVKIYDITTQEFLTDGEGNIRQTMTNSDGEYSFAKIENGSYLVVFDYDMNDYEPTIYCAEGVNPTINSKVQLSKIVVNGENKNVWATNTIEVKENITSINLGLKVKESSNEEIEGDGLVISGFAWLDLDRDGQKDSKEATLQGIKVKIYNPITKDYLKDSNGNIVETSTDSNGKYIFSNLEEGAYIILFEYDTEEYEPTIYCAEGVNPTINSKVILKKLNIDGKEKVLAVTDKIELQENMLNINIGLKEKLVFDLELHKGITRIVVQNKKETKAYDYKNSNFEKVEIHKKQLQGSLVVLEYTIKVKNNGEIAGYAKDIVDYLPSGLTFSSELNKDWYLSANNLYTKGLENVELKPGEEKEVKLILTKTMTENNVGLINNRAEIYKDYNVYGEIDIDSTPNNQVESEDDMDSADVIIMVATGGNNIIYIILIFINIVLIGLAIKLMIKKQYN